MTRAGPGSEDPHSALSFETAKAGLCLRSLTGADAPVLRELVLRNSRHLTRHGDYRELVDMSADSLADELSKRDGRTWRFGIFLDHSLIGRVDLIGVEPPRYSVGYWLSEHAAGQGNSSAPGRHCVRPLGPCGLGYLCRGYPREHTKPKPAASAGIYSCRDISRLQAISSPP
jgi:hypothetical protein